MADCESELLIDSLMKKQFLPYSKSEPEIALMKMLKHTMDLHGILNPGRVF